MHPAQNSDGLSVPAERNGEFLSQLLWPDQDGVFEIGFRWTSNSGGTTGIIVDGAQHVDRWHYRGGRRIPRSALHSRMTQDHDSLIFKRGTQWISNSNSS